MFRQGQVTTILNALHIEHRQKGIRFSFKSHMLEPGSTPAVADRDMVQVAVFNVEAHGPFLGSDWAHIRSRIHNTARAGPGNAVFATRDADRNNAIVIVDFRIWISVVHGLVFKLYLLL